ncbi:TM0106 family RecB-like putative nuclease [Bailinhaonella thermotolerans]|uniref:TM0106 family RecB-like putative nuclease n=1 Tax=Bailinhaonella thermotolerans TaxID=1070861 RepID=A0A3A4A553_9ACTN|nr:TM0106 family RecB-like putative nuclease [Bailinhaonella thermotolerans]RJL23956.1 TM0106 family RecB-like putative nuclease [Bailinhaonella thermotolerans]
MTDNRHTSGRQPDELPNFGGYFAKQCPNEVRLDADPDYDPAMKLPPAPGLQALFDAGNAFEAEVERHLRDAHSGRPGVVFLRSPADRSDPAAKRDWEARSMAAFADPAVRMLWNARLAPVPSEHLTGEPDMAVRADGGGWYPIDVKWHRELDGEARPKPWPVSSLGAPYLERAAPTELTGSARLQDCLQLAHYHRMFQAHGLAVPEGAAVWGGVIGRGLRVVWFRLDEPLFLHPDRDGARRRMSALEIYDQERALRLGIVRREHERRAAPGLPSLALPQYDASRCPGCGWRRVCMDAMTRAGDITLVPGITPAKASAFRGRGVHAITDLAGLHHPTAVAVQLGLDVPAVIEAAAGWPRPGAPAREVLRAFRPKRTRTRELTLPLAEAGVVTVADLAGLDPVTAGFARPRVANLPELIDRARVRLAGTVHRARGSDFAGFPRASIEVDIDFEDVPGHTYLFGALVTRRKRRPDGQVHVRSDYRPFTCWDGTADGEARALAEFWAELRDLIGHADAHRLGIRIYHYSHHEDAALRELARRHAGAPGVPTAGQVEELLADPRWVDLRPILAEDLIWPTLDYSIKSLAKLAGHQWSGEDDNGATSQAWYRDAVEHPDAAVREAMRERLTVYNHQDNLATLRIREYLVRFAESQRRPGENLPSVADLGENAPAPARQTAV